MIYFIQAAEGGPIKIGYTKSVPERVKRIEQESGRKMIVLAAIPGTKSDERKLHQRFAHLRLEGTEHFRPTVEITAFITCEKAPDPSRPATKGRNIKLTEEVYERLRLVSFRRRSTISATVNEILERSLPALRIVNDAQS